MTNLSATEREAFKLEKLEELRATLRMISHWMVLPLYFLFWICDIAYVPEYKWEFLALRCTVIPSCLVVSFLLKRLLSFRSSEWLALFFIFSLASAINMMIVRIGDYSTPYYAGLNLVAIGALTFIPWERLFFALGFLVIFGPYYLGAALRIQDWDDFRGLLVHTFFIVSTALIALVIRVFHERLRILEFKSRLRLNDEIGNRDSIIIQKTEEAVRLGSLSRQFSPQVVEAIKSKKIELTSKTRRSKICAIFVDIVNSTERVVRVDKDKVHMAISAFMDDTIKILLKYDITVDKFLGDGILAFANNPVEHADYAQRVIMAAFEIRNKVLSRTEFYENHWMSPLETKIGVAVGSANVGFYGNERYFRTYTAIGPVVNLASRLCGAAQPSQILISEDTFALLPKEEYSAAPLGNLTLKGFENETVKAYAINLLESKDRTIADDTDCPACSHGILRLDLNEKGIYVLKCGSCGYVKADNLFAPRTRKAS